MTSATRPTTPPVHEHADAADPRAGGQRPVELVRGAPPGADALTRPHASAPARGAARARRARRGARSPASRHRPPAAERAGTRRKRPSPQRSSASVSASRAASLGSPSTTLTTRPVACACRRPHQHVAGAQRVAGLDAGHERVARRSASCGSPPPAGGRPSASRATRRVDDAGEAPVAHEPGGQRGEVARGRVAARVVEPDRVRVARVVEPELRARAGSSPPRSAPWLPDTPRASVTAASLALSSSSASSRSATVIRSPGRQVDPRLRRRGVVGRRGEHVARPRPLEHQQRGHQLGGAGDRPALVRGRGRTCTCPSRASTTIAARRLDRRRRGAAGGRGTGQRRGQRRPRRRRCARAASLAQLDLLAREQRLRVELRVELLEALHGHAGLLGDAPERVAGLDRVGRRGAARSWSSVVVVGAVVPSRGRAAASLPPPSSPPTSPELTTTTATASANTTSASGARRRAGLRRPDSCILLPGGRGAA